MDDSRRWVGRFLVVAFTLPTMTNALGVDGGTLFQILAVENLGLTPAAIGTALGLGVVSVPIQLWAARMTLEVARRNLLWFFALAVLGCWGLAALIALAGADDPARFGALVLTVLAEIAVSVLFATSWQPLLSTMLSTRDRQTLNARGRALGSLALGGVLVVFGSAGPGLRVLVLAVVGLAGIATLVLLLAVPRPSGSTATASAPASAASAPAPAATESASAGARSRGEARRLPPAARPLLVLAGFGAASAWPLFPVYAAEVSWPTVDLGIVGAVETAAFLSTAALWRSTERSLVPRARTAAWALVAAAVLFVLLPTGTASGIVDVVSLGAFGVAVAARSVLLMSMLELLHRVVSERSAVRVLTILDVVASTSIQAALFAAGWLVTWSATTRWGPVDPYQLALLVLALGAAASLVWVRTETPAVPVDAP